METYCALLAKRDERTAVPSVLLTPVGEQWRLPAFTPREEIHNTDIPAANETIRAQLGVPVTTRYALRLSEKEIPGPLNIYVTETRFQDRAAIPAVQGGWFRCEETHRLNFAWPRQKAVVEAWFAEAQGEPFPSLDIPWWREGWFADAAARLEATAADAGRTVLSPAEQLRSAVTSAILRVQTDTGALYAKVLPSVFAREAAVMQALAEQDPAHFPLPAAVEGTWLFMEDMGGRPLGYGVPLARWQAIVRTYAQMQVDSVASVDRWLRSGCLDLRVQHLAAQLETLLADVPARLRGLPQRLSEMEIEQLQACLPRLKEGLTVLMEIGVPDALEHGDLHAGNIVVTDSGFLLYDWSHACITCPFYGFGSLFFDDDWFPEQPEALPQLEAAYLEPWTAFLPRERLLTAFALWKRLRPLLEAMHQSRVIAAYQAMLEEEDYVPETATGNALETMQWWPAAGLRKLIRTCSEEG
jgi:hypothetical protein